MQLSLFPTEPQPDPNALYCVKCWAVLKQSGHWFDCPKCEQMYYLTVIDSEQCLILKKVPFHDNKTANKRTNKNLSGF